MEVHGKSVVKYLVKVHGKSVVKYVVDVFGKSVVKYVEDVCGKSVVKYVVDVCGKSVVKICVGRHVWWVPTYLCYFPMSLTVNICSRITNDERRWLLQNY